MKKFLCALMLVCAVSSCALADVSINTQNFPDDTFREYVSREFDDNDDRVLTDYDITFITTINVESMDVSSLRGIEYFSALQILNCESNDLTELDLHNNTQIKEVWAENNQLASINLSGLTALEKIGLHGNNITALDVSSFTNLIELHCGDNPLASLTLGNKPALTRLYVYRDQLDTLDVSQCPALEELHFGGNNITAIDVSRCPALKYLHCWNNNLSTLDLSACPAMEDLNCTGSRITTLTLGNHPNLKMLDCEGNYIEALNLSGCPSLEDLNFTNNRLSSINITNCPALEYIDAQNNQLTELDISRNTHLKLLNLNNLIDDSVNTDDGRSYFVPDLPQNKLTSLNTNNNPELEELYIDGNEISSLNLSNNRSLRRLHCIGDNISTLDVSYCPNMESLLVGGNNLTELNTRQLTELISLDAAGNNITAGDFSSNRKLRFLCYNNTHIKNADVSQNTALIDLRFWSTDLEALDVSRCSQLETLHVHDSKVTSLTLGNHSNLRELQCRRNYISALNVTGCPALEELSCHNNLLTELDVSHNTNLTILECYDMPTMNIPLDVSNNEKLITLNCGFINLKTPDFSHNTALQYLYCDGNHIESLDLSHNTALKELTCRLNSLTELDLSNNAGLEYVDCAANKLESITFNSSNSITALHCMYNSFAALDLEVVPSLNTQNFFMRRQRVRRLEVALTDNNDYPYQLNFNGYMSSGQINNIEASSVKGLNSEGEDIDTSYSSGIARFADSPAMVRYVYDMGLNMSMDVTIADGYMLFGKTSYNGHVYQAITDKMTWSEAEEHCESLGGYLAVIDTGEEEEAVEELLVEMSLTSDDNMLNYWLGGQYDVEGELGYSAVAFLIYGDTWNMKRELKFDREHDTFAFICEWEPASADFAPEAQEYTRYVENPDAYFTGNDFFGAVPEQVDLSHLADNPPNVDEAEGAFHSSALSSRYDPRASGLLPSVKRQNPYDTCWSFSSLGALETSYNVLNNRTNAPDLSELYQAWFVFRDPRRGYSFELNDANKPLLNQGGDNSKAIAFLSHSGTARESDLPYTSAANIESLTAGKTPDNYDHPLRLREALRIGNITASNREAVKNLIVKYGAVSIAYYHNNSVSLTQNAYYLETAQNFGHAVCIVGWDDDYSASSFKSNGAWLAKNSWGEDFGDGGYFWLSYEQSIGDGAVFIADDSSDSLTLKGYDVLTDTGRIDYHWSANVFIAEGTEHAREVAFHTTDNNVPYEVYINKLGRDRPSNPGTPTTAIASGTMPYAGYHTITLREPVEIEDGEYFSVIVRLGTSSTYQYASAVEDSGSFSAASVRAGESYFAKDNTLPSESDWKDGMSITDNGTPRACNACIKVFISVSPSTPTPTESEDIATPVAPQAGDSSGGGGCSSSSLPALSMMILALVALRKTR